jgi:hypothetical protein
MIADGLMLSIRSASVFCFGFGMFSALQTDGCEALNTAER